MHLGKKQMKISHLKSSTCEGGGGRSLKCQPISVFMEKREMKTLVIELKCKGCFWLQDMGQKLGLNKAQV